MKVLARRTCNVDTKACRVGEGRRAGGAQRQRQADLPRLCPLKLLNHPALLIFV